MVAFPVGIPAIRVFERILGGNHDAAEFAVSYFDFISIWIGLFLVAVIFKNNRPMLNAVKYQSPRVLSCGAGAAGGNRAGNNVRGLLVGLALGFGSSGFCILMSALMGDICLEYAGFQPLPFIMFFLCVFIQSAGEELTDRWYLYQKLRRRYKAPWIAIGVNSFSFMALHLFNPGISFIAVLQIFIIGVIFSLLVYYYNGLWIAMAFHASWNFSQSIFFGLPNSGNVTPFSIFKLEASNARDSFCYNVGFGVEGTILACVVMVIVGILIILYGRKKDLKPTEIWAD
jgi:membrane protease YdiL (CAAX protease family)